MKASILALSLIVVFSMASFAQQDKSQRASPPDSTTVTTDDGVTIAIHYSKPSLKGRQIGVDVAPVGQVWRTGANEATTFEVNKDVQVQGQTLPAGKYSLYSIPDEYEVTIIFNKVWEQWGTRYDETQDALRVKAAPTASSEFKEQFTIKADQTGKVDLVWGDSQVSFSVKAAN